MGDIRALYSAEQDAVAQTVQANTYVEGYEEREPSRARVVKRHHQLQQLYAAIWAPTSGILHSTRH